MAGNQLKLNGRVQASTIMEVIIAMVLILVVFTIAMMISANVMRASPSAKKQKAAALLQDRMIKAMQNPVTGTATVNAGEFQLSQEIKPSENSKSLVSIRLTALDANADTVAVLQEICPAK